MTRRSPDELPGLSAELAEGLKEVSDELREVSRGIHPTILTEAGLGPALRALARRSDVPVDVDVRLDERLPAPVEAAAYYIASEALTNVAKHAHANVVQLSATHDDGSAFRASEPQRSPQPRPASCSSPGEVHAILPALRENRYRYSGL